MKEINLEVLVGRRVVDSNGKKVGRIEEVTAVEHGDDLVVREYLVGTYGFAQRFSLFGIGLHFIRLFGARTRATDAKRIPWNKLDLSDEDHPRLTCTKEELNGPM